MKITEFLKSLGSTSEEISASLLSMGITGEKCKPDFCPIVKAIYHKFPQMSKGLKVGFYYHPRRTCYMSGWGYFTINAHTSFKITWEDCQTSDPEVPEGIKEFVKDFDKGKYPFLEGKSKSELKKEILEKLTVEEKMVLGI